MKKNLPPSGEAKRLSVSLKLLVMMKLAIMVILFTAYHAQAEVYGQQVTVQVQQTEIKKVLNELEKKAKVRFLYNYELTTLNKKVDFNVQNTSLTVALDKLLKGTGLTYKVLDDNLIVIMNAGDGEQNQSNRVTGKVTDETGKPLQGVSILIKGTAKGTTTNEQGVYTLSATAGDVLVVSYVGYDAQEIAVVADKGVYDATLQSGKSQLSEIVVVGYGTQRKKDVTGAVAVVSADDFKDRPIVNAAQALQGQAAGVQVFAPSGKPGSGMNVSIRGNTSLNASNAPLYVVDGVIVADINFLNAQDIESFSILKDASSAAIYGASGANGVVLITTKKGTTGKGRISVNAYTGFSNFAKKIPVLNKDQYLALMTEMGYTDNNTGNTDWQKEAFGTGHDNNLQLSYSGGNADNKYYVSAGYQKQSGVVAPANYERYSVRVNLSNKVREWLNVTTNMNYVTSKSIDVADNAGVAKGGTILSALTSPPTIGIYNPDGTFTSNPNKGGWENPIAAAFGPDQQARDNRLIGNLAADVNIIKGLVFRSNMGIEYAGYRWDYFLDPFRTDYGRAQKGYGKSKSTQRFVWLWENTLTYNKRWNDHSLTALVGTTMQESNYNESYAEGRDYPNASVGSLNAAAIKLISTTTQAQWARRSYLARVNYAYKDKYLLTANTRYDGSSRFPSGSRYGWFPSVSAGWRISGEDFMSTQKIFSDLKLRAGWGKTGNDGIGDYDYWARFSPNGTGGFNFNNLAKDNLTWEKTSQSNLGLDAAFLHNRLRLTIDAYVKKTTDLLVSVQPPPSGGFDKQVYNLGAIENKGLEFAVMGLVLDKAVKWTVNANLSINKNKVTALGDYTKVLTYGSIYDGRGDAIRVEVGKPLGAIYGYISDGVDPQTGMIKYRDLDGKAGITADDRTYLGYAQPDFVYGLTNTFNYKNFELSFFLQGVQGNKMFNASRMELESMNDSKNQSADVLNRWKTPGQITDIPKAVKGSTDNTMISSRFVENASYLRMKSLSLRYNFTGNFLKKAGISRLGVYATGQNLFTITKYKGFDPEVSQYTDANSIGIDYGTYPQARTFIFGVNVDF